MIKKDTNIRHLTKAQILDKSKALEPTIRIGKNGINDSVISEIKKQLDKRKLIKIKLLRSALDSKDKKELFEEISEVSEAEVISKIGFTIVLKKN